MTLDDATPAPTGVRCCGAPPHVVALTQDDGAKSLVELVRCSACGQSSWRLNGQDVPKEQALGALTAAFAPATPATRATRVRDRDPEVREDRALSELLAGWQVLGSQR